MRTLHGLMLAFTLAACTTTDVSSETSAIAITPVVGPDDPDPNKCQYYEATECEWKRSVGGSGYCIAKSFKWTACEHSPPSNNFTGTCKHIHASKECPGLATEAECVLTNANNGCLWKYITDYGDTGNVCEEDPEACGIALEPASVVD